MEGICPYANFGTILRLIPFVGKWPGGETMGVKDKAAIVACQSIVHQFRKAGVMGPIKAFQQTGPFG